jgi:hypothetical protein
MVTLSPAAAAAWAAAAAAASMRVDGDVAAADCDVAATGDERVALAAAVPADPWLSTTPPGLPVRTAASALCARRREVDGDVFGPVTSAVAAGAGDGGIATAPRALTTVLSSPSPAATARPVALSLMSAATSPTDPMLTEGVRRGCLLYAAAEGTEEEDDAAVAAALEDVAGATATKKERPRPAPP